MTPAGSRMMAIRFQEGSKSAENFRWDSNSRAKPMSETFTFSEIDLPAAIRGLREALGRPPEVMAQILGCSLPAYLKWEAGSLTPGGEWLIRMLQICPNEETRNAFRIRAERRATPRQRLETNPQSRGRLSPEERLRCRLAARDALDALSECGQAGVEAADLRLRDFAENLQHAARYYLSRIKQASDSE